MLTTIYMGKFLQVWIGNVLYEDEQTTLGRLPFP